ncbi:heat shock protein 90, putative [Babesia bigemina]|uniref:Heat shock protein 90, putative n=1 Tax=Babesia bigemina TaxID=5866 RepID=A0A061D0W8_BABBI|nr:heat shock protein 90, putative [Babesia bigemina]CDR94273.1 heat shock protein 90, putative [Babesia bigemina]|eukprot:XP_012766459.1 heat shock protein 90, putative [Babesia bigemina]
MRRSFAVMLQCIATIFAVIHFQNVEVFANEEKGVESSIDSADFGSDNIQPRIHVESTEEDTSDGAADSEVVITEPEDTVSLSDDEMSSAAKHGESHTYQADFARVMDIIVNSLYSKKEVFLRELISNSADALEKYKILELRENRADSGDELAIRIRASAAKRTLTILDTGVGMTKHELINNLGTIAKSGTANFVDAISKGENDANLIGQFGVGFYSVFLVADSVVVQSKHWNDKQYVWKSSADTKYELYEDPKGNTLGEHGTQITLFLKEDATEYLEAAKIEELIKKHSQFVRFPIYVLTVDKESKEAKWKHVNDVKPIWARDKSEITDEEYTEFYQAISGARSKPLAHIHFVAEGDVEFRSLLFIPERPKSSYFDTDDVGHQVKIYARRVLVSDRLPDFLPRYLYSICGVVDSDNFPLNVSREHLQHSKMIKIIGKKIVRSVLSTLQNLMKESFDSKKKLQEEIDAETDEEKKTELTKKLTAKTTFDKFYQNFRGSLKVACYDDASNRKKIAKLLMYQTSKHKSDEITLDQYIAEMPETQKAIYYASGDSYNAIHSSPHLQGFHKRGIDVLYLTDTMDESCINQLYEYEGKSFKSVQKGDVDFERTQEEVERDELTLKKYAPLIKVLKENISEIYDVQLSRRLTDDPCIVVVTEWGMSPNMEKIVKSYVVNKKDDDVDPFGSGMRSRILEINGDHPIMIELLKRCKNDTVDSSVIDSMKLLYNAAKLAGGFSIENPTTLTRTAYSYLSDQLNVDASATIDDIAYTPEAEDETTESPEDMELEEIDLDDEGKPVNDEL